MEIIWIKGFSCYYPCFRSIRVRFVGLFRLRDDIILLRNQVHAAFGGIYEKGTDVNKSELSQYMPDISATQTVLRMDCSFTSWVEMIALREKRRIQSSNICNLYLRGKPH